MERGDAGVAKGCVCLLEWHEELDEVLTRARSGDSASREEFLKIYQPYVLQVTEKFCGKRLEWGKDDQLSVGLIALNEAVDRYSPDRSGSFPAFAGMVIKSRLKDYYRREKRQLPTEVNFLQEEGGGDPAGYGPAWDAYREEKAARERGAEIEEYKKMLAYFDISFSELVEIAPKREDSRRQLISAARELAMSQQNIESLFRHRRVPLNELSAACGVARKTLERGRKYIIAISIVLHNKEKFSYLGSYLKLGRNGEVAGR